MNVYINNKKIRLRARSAIGKGGEADVYDIGGGQALKLFKQPDHPDFLTDPNLAHAARQRLNEQQRKLKDFPQSLAEPVITPRDLAYDACGKSLVGYTMRRINSPVSLVSFGDRTFRQQGVGVKQVLEVLRQLHTAVAEIHASQVVLGDFNDLNVLVTDVATSPQVWLIDADSFQFGVYPCRVFTDRFVDPRLCDPKAPAPLLAAHHDTDSDWYAFTVMVVRCLLLTDPYGGIYKPRAGGARVPAPQRPLHRISVFHPEVRYPKPAHPREILPDNWLDHLDQVFHQDLRGLFPRDLLNSAIWSTCTACGLEHARRACPRCRRQLAMAPPPRTVTGLVECTLLLLAEGTVVAAAVDGSGPRWLVHEAGSFRREDGSVALEGPLQPDLSFGLLGPNTLVAQGDQLVVLGGQPPQRLSIESRTSFATHDRHLFRLEDGRLVRDEPLGPVLVGEVLAGQTSFWVGEAFGFGYYWAGRLAVAFVFETESTGLNDNVRLPPLPGQWLAASCTFTAERCWLLVTARDAGQTCCHAIVVRRDGRVEASASGDPRVTTWLAGLQGACAVEGGLLVPTDDGVVRVGIVEDQLLEKGTFADTEPHVDVESRLLASADGLVVVGEREIKRLVMRP